MSSSRAETINCRSALADRKLVPDDQVRIFSEILQFRYRYGEHHDTEEGRTIYYNRIRPLLPKLKFPVGSNPGFAWKLILPKQSEYTYLCGLHKGLNADFVHQWFKFLALEVGARMEPLRATNREFVGEFAWDYVVKPLSRLHKIWETEEKIQEAFGTFLDTGLEGTKDLMDVTRQSDGCEACILARIASHARTVLALRIAVKSRISLESSARHSSRLRLLRLIEPWVELWQARIDKKSDRYEIATQQVRESTQLAKEIYIKREKIKLYWYESKHQEKEKDVLHQAENDEIDSFAALRASQRVSQAIRTQASIQQMGGPSARPTGERNPYASNVDPAYRESRYSNDTVLNDRRVIEGSSALTPNLHDPKRSSNDSVQTSWGDVMAGGARGGNAFMAKASPLGRIPEEHPVGNIQGRQGSVRKPVRGAVPELKSTVNPYTYAKLSDKATYQSSAVSSVYSQASRDPTKHNVPVPTAKSVYPQVSADEINRHFPDISSSSSVYSQPSRDPTKHDTPDVGASSIYSQVSNLSTQNRYDDRSSVSSMNTYDEYHHQHGKPRNPNRESQASEWTNATMETDTTSTLGNTPKSRLSRPFDQPAFDEYGSDLSKDQRYR